MNALAAWVRTRQADPALALMRRRALRRFVAELPRGAAIAELGCGPGDDAARLAALGFGVRALDLDPAMVRLARARLARTSAEIVRASFAHPPTGWSGTFDGVWSFHAADHPPGLTAFARSCDRLLRPGGVAVFTAAMRWRWQRVRAWLRAPRPRVLRVRPGPGFVPVRYAGRVTRVEVTTPSGITKLFPSSFDAPRFEPLGLLLPGAASAPGGGRWMSRAWLRRLDAMETRRPFRDCVRLADHALVIVRKR